MVTLYISMGYRYPSWCVLVYTHLGRPFYCPFMSYAGVTALVETLDLILVSLAARR
jgi:hypothetical protein